MDLKDVQKILDEFDGMLKKATDHLENELTKVRAGRANPSMLDSVHVDYYGLDTPLGQVSNLSTPDARTIQIQPWEKKMIEPIEKAIIAANLGLNPSNNGEVVLINVPMLTEERRKDLTKTAHKEGENAKISIRSARHKALDSLKKAQKDGLPEDAVKSGESDVQGLTDKYNKRVDALVKAKEDDIMKV